MAAMRATRSIILLDLPTGNVMSDFASEGEAWAALRDWARDEGLDAVSDLSLMRIQEGDPIVIAMDDELVQRVARELREAHAHGHHPRKSEAIAP